uniref:Acyl-CoA dehydrogenase/oxidase N-terminal domain-containing protein n=1 Tax=Brassica campestris TaxID=3711 RepID=A0A3P5YRA2_BRACM|nr:unnamed protein product [Brassica rapa]
MNVFVAFPQATPASKFPTCEDFFFFQRIYIFSSDYYHFSELLTPEEQAVRKRVREFMEKEVAPIMTEKAEFPFHIIPKLGALGVVGGSIKVCYGCPGHITANAIATADISSVDASCGTFNLVLSLEKTDIQLMIPHQSAKDLHIVEFLGTGEVVRIKTPNGWCLPMDSLPSHVHCAITPAQLGDLSLSNFRQ